MLLRVPNGMPESAVDLSCARCCGIGPKCSWLIWSVRYLVLVERSEARTPERRDPALTDGTDHRTLVILKSKKSMYRYIISSWGSSGLT